MNQYKCKVPGCSFSSKKEFGLVVHHRRMHEPNKMSNTKNKKRPAHSSRSRKGYLLATALEVARENPQGLRAHDMAVAIQEKGYNPATKVNSIATHLSAVIRNNKRTGIQRINRLYKPTASTMNKATPVKGRRTEHAITTATATATPVEIIDAENESLLESIPRLTEAQKSAVYEYLLRQQQKKIDSLTSLAGKAILALGD